jgi:hypothetical protein
MQRQRQKMEEAGTRRRAALDTISTRTLTHLRLFALLTPRSPSFSLGWFLPNCGCWYIMERWFGATSMSTVFPETDDTVSGSDSVLQKRA